MPPETCKCGEEAEVYTPWGWMCLTCYKRTCEEEDQTMGPLIPEDKS